MKSRTLLLTVALACASGNLLAADNAGGAARTNAPAAKAKAPAKPKVELPTFTDPAKAGQDWLDQGEFAGESLGAQVIALGNDRFRLVLHKGGLPGAGWDKSPKTEIEGRRAGGEIVFNPTPNGAQYRLANGALTGGPVPLKKVIRTSPTLEAKPPAGAIVLFDGTNADAWQGGHLDDRKLLAAGCKSKQSFTNFSLHLEFILPFKPLGRGQDRGNSGVYLQDRYEVQVLDSFGLKGEDNECGGFYQLGRPLVNMCFPPLTWQTYDIDFETAQYDDAGKKTKNAVATVKHNGVVIHDRLELRGPTGGGKKEDPRGGAIQLQGHGNPVFYRNIWIIPK